MSVDASQCAMDIWRAGLDAVRADIVVQENVYLDGSSLHIASESIPLESFRRICVVGAGKAGAGMAGGLEAALEPLGFDKDRFFGWINVPEGTSATPLSHLRLHAARPPYVNEPTLAAVQGTQEIVKLVENLDSDDICICLLSGGGSALLPLPTAEISLEQKIRLTRDLSAAGASIQQLNTVRKFYSDIKGGGLARRCNAGRLIGLIISDVIEDPIDLIASGPTVTENTEVSLEPLVNQLTKNGARQSLEFVQRVLNSHNAPRSPVTCSVSNHIIANNDRAVNAAALKARDLGLSCTVLPSEMRDTTADELGAELGRHLIEMVESRKPTCVVSGGEPVVKLVPEADRGIGGRNQQLVLSALCELNSASNQILTNDAADFALLSAGTDGEDGPTDSAGAVCNRNVMTEQIRQGIDPKNYLRRNDAYNFFAQTDGLIRTGPTSTNVCDVRVLVQTPTR